MRGDSKVVGPMLSEGDFVLKPRATFCTKVVLKSVKFSKGPCATMFEGMQNSTNTSNSKQVSLAFRKNTPGETPSNHRPITKIFEFTMFCIILLLSRCPLFTPVYLSGSLMDGLWGLLC